MQRVKFLRAAAFLGGVVFLASCGYRWSPHEARLERPTFSLPFAVGDEDGLFTAEMSSALTASGLAHLRSSEGDFRLEITLLSEGLETIGFRKDKQKVNGKNKRNMVACEARKKIAAEVTLFSGSSDQIVFGPCRIEADTDLDYVDGDSYKDLTFVDPQGAPQAVLPFSLGQLEAYESAREAAKHPLYSRLAQKIVDVIFSRAMGDLL